MEHMSEDAQVLIRAAREVHVERHGAQTFLPGTYLSFLEAAKRTGISPAPRSLDSSPEEVSPVTGLATKRKGGAHVAAYSGRGVGLHARRQGESKTQVPIPEHLRAGEGGVPQPFRRGHQARRSYAHKGGIRGCPHRGRPYGQRTRKGCPGHL